MRTAGWSVVALLVVVCLIPLAGCSDDGGGNGQGGQGGTVTGELFADNGQGFVPLANQRVEVGDRFAFTDAGGSFEVEGVAPGNFVIQIQTPPDFGVVLNPDALTGSVERGQTTDVGRILLGERPPEA